jgi:hypothetical protein
MSRQTISFHLSSSIATERGNSNYELVLSPGLEIPHAAKDCTVYLHNLLFNNCLANVSGPLYQNNQVVLTLSGQTPINIDLGPSALSIPDVERLIGEHLYTDQSGMWAALTTAAEALGENVKLASPYELNWNHTIDVTAGIDAIPEAAHLSESNIYLKPVTLFADTVQNRVQAVVLGGLEVTGSLWEKLLGFSSTQIGNNSQAVMTAASVARVDATRAIAFHCPTLCAGTFGTDGKLGGSQLALVPITVGLGQTQSYQVSVPIKLPCRAAGTKVTALNFFLSNEDGDACDLLQDRFEAVVVVEWSI